MIPSRLLHVVAGALVALAIAIPASGQGKGGSNKGGHGKPPSASTIPAVIPTAASPDATTDAGTSPFAWMDDASLMAPGSVWLGVSMVRWHGAGVSETIVPSIDAAIGLAPRVQLGASVPRVGGGVGTSFFGAKIGVLQGDDRLVKIAAAPTLEIIGNAALDAGGASRRAQFGVPVSVHVDHQSRRIYASSGFFSPGVWFAGAGIGTAIGDRTGVSVSFSRAWALSDSPTASGLRRNEISGGASFGVRPNLAVFGSVGRTIGMTAEEGAGTTLAFGFSVSAAPAGFLGERP